MSDGPAEPVDLVVVGAGAAGLMASIWAARGPTSSERGRIVLVDGARTLGAKILVAGGGRCNVTHDVVDERAYAGSTPAAIRKVLRRFDVPATTAFFRELGVELKREETGKLFPVTNDARTVLTALLGAVAASGVELVHPWKVESIRRLDTHFELRSGNESILAQRVVLATGGKSLPKSGSDGGGYRLATTLGHSLTPHIFPALVPLLLPEGHPLRDLSGLTFPAEVRLVASSGKLLQAFTDSTLCTHFGLSGPSILDISRHLAAARLVDRDAHLELNFLPGTSAERLDRELVEARRATPLAALRSGMPDRLARFVCAMASVDPAANLRQLGKEDRKRLVRAATGFSASPTGDRGWNHAEVTAGGVPLAELHLDSMESRVCPGLFIVGELCDVDGRIGGFNFQWAWASGFVAGTSVLAPAARAG